MMRLKIIILSVLLSVVSSAYAAQQYAIVTPGAYAGLQFGYLDAHYGDVLDRYSAVSSTSNNNASGSNYNFHGLLGYNFTPIYGVEIGLMNYKDNSDGSTGTITRKASMNLTLVNVVATFHLKLNDSSSWVGTPKFGLALEHGTLGYQYTAPSGSPPWGGGNVNESQTRNFIEPTAGVSFDHSFDSHLVMSFAYQYYFGGYGGTYNDPYHTSASSIHYFSVGGSYKF